MLLYLVQLLTQVLLVTAMHSDSILHSHIVFTEYLGIRHEAKHSITHYSQQQQKYSVFAEITILITYVPQRTEFIASYLEITCIYCILIDTQSGD